jgi:hypothetical protein
MRWTLPLLLLAACEPRRNPRNIERALAAKTIDVEALEDLLKVEPDALRVVQPAIASVRTAPPTGEWILENVGPRPVWIRRDDLRLAVDVTPFVPSRAGDKVYGGRRSRTPPRPRFAREEWLLLERGAHVPLHPEVRIVEPGQYDLQARMLNRGRVLLRQVEEFNAGRPLPPKYADPTLASHHGSFLLLPSPDWAGAP